MHWEHGESSNNDKMSYWKDWWMKNVIETVELRIQKDILIAIDENITPRIESVVR